MLHPWKRSYYDTIGRVCQFNGRQSGRKSGYGKSREDYLADHMDSSDAQGFGIGWVIYRSGIGCHPPDRQYPYDNYRAASRASDSTR